MKRNIINSSSAFGVNHMENITVQVTHPPQNKNITLLSVKGQIDTFSAPEFAKKLLSVLGEKKFKLIVDLKAVEYISSAGWGIFISEIKNIRSQRGDMVLVGMNPQVSEVFKLLQFDSIMKAFPNVDSALQKCFEN